MNFLAKLPKVQFLSLTKTMLETHPIRGESLVWHFRTFSKSGIPQKLWYTCMKLKLLKVIYGYAHKFLNIF